MNKPSAFDFWAVMVALAISIINAWHVQDRPILYGIILVMAGMAVGAFLAKLRLEFLAKRS